MDQRTIDLLNWAKTYTTENNTLQLDDFTYIEDLEKCISTLAARVEKIETTKVFVAYKDQLIFLKKKLEDQKN